MGSRGDNGDGEVSASLLEAEWMWEQGDESLSHSNEERHHELRRPQESMKRGRVR